jgi:hypothetical protein
VELRKLDLAVPVRGPHERDVDSHAGEPDAVHPTSLDGHLDHQLHPEFDEERGGSLEVVDDDADVVHPLDRHRLRVLRSHRVVDAGSRGRARPTTHRGHMAPCPSASERA